MSFLLLPTHTVKELIRPEIKPVLRDRGAGVERAAVAEVVHGQLLVLRAGRQHEGAASPRDVVQLAVGQDRRGVDLAHSAFDPLFVDDLARGGFRTVGNAEVLVHPVDVPVVENRRRYVRPFLAGPEAMRFRHVSLASGPDGQGAAGTPTDAIHDSIVGDHARHHVPTDVGVAAP